MRKTSFIHLYLWLFVLPSCVNERYPGPLSPEEALRSFQLAADFEIDLYAAEPNVCDPVEMVFDESGHAYVVEMPDYPYKPEPEQAKGCIKRLIDGNGDGRIDSTIVFADRLSEATSLLPWEGGFLVTAAPHIYFLKDTTGDFRADIREVLFSGFFENNSEAQITNLRFCVDNWIYAGNFGQPGKVVFHRHPDSDTLFMRGGDFRFRLDRGIFELATGPTQFGQAINDWGHRFLTQNTIHLRHAVIPYRYLKRNPYLPSKKADPNISDHDLRMFQDTPPPYWRAERTRRRQKRYDEEKLNRTEYAEDHFTGASGATAYLANGFPAEFYGNVFIGDVAGNLIHRDILQLGSKHPTYLAKRAPSEQEREFLSSTDSWFRPANFTVGPDGWLYVLDYYRQHIETPLSIPEDLKEEMDFYRGSDRGRIYRIRPRTKTIVAQPVHNLRQKSSAKLLQLLSHTDGWWRLQAQRLLLERQDFSTLPTLLDMFRDQTNVLTRLHALYLLEGMNALTAELARSAIEDPHPRIREHGIILSERFPENRIAMLNKLSDDDTRVVFQTTLSIGNYEGPDILEGMASVLEKYGKDEWFSKAVLSSPSTSSNALLDLLIQRKTYFTSVNETHRQFLRDLGKIILARSEEKEIALFWSLVETLPNDYQTDDLMALRSEPQAQ